MSRNVHSIVTVFDMTGFGLSNTDWDTATMAINVFQSYYPETLGHAIVWNAPMVFSAVWKIVKPMLDPVVREKIAFCSNAKEISKVSLIAQLPSKRNHVEFLPLAHSTLISSI